MHRTPIGVITPGAAYSPRSGRGPAVVVDGFATCVITRRTMVVFTEAGGHGAGGGSGVATMRGFVEMFRPVEVAEVRVPVVATEQAAERVPAGVPVQAPQVEKVAGRPEGSGF